MRTTLELEDGLFKKVKMKAVEEGITFRVFVERALERELSMPARGISIRKSRAERLFSQLDKAANEKPLGELKRSDLYDRPVLRRH